MGELDPARPVLAVCRSGNRSGTALNMLKKSGFKEVKHLGGGLSAWSSKGLPLTKEN